MKCATVGCLGNAYGKSKYCIPHKAEAHKAFVSMIKAKAEERSAKVAGFEAIWSEAHAAGMKAGEAAIPTPMVVAQHANVLDDNSPVTKAWYVSEGPCGFASVIVRPGNHSFALWAKKAKDASKNYYGGMTVKWVGEFGQSIARKEAYAEAFASVLKAHNIPATVSSRLD